MKFKFKELKETYIEIKNYLEKASGEKVTGLHTKIANDLSLWGDDNYFLLENFVIKNNLNFDNFDYSEYFESEGELFSGSKMTIGLLIFPLLIVAGIIKWIFPKLKTPFDDSFSSNRIDLTFGDLIVCKFKGEFCLRKNTLIEM